LEFVHVVIRDGVWGLVYIVVWRFCVDFGVDFGD